MNKFETEGVKSDEELFAKKAAHDEMNQTISKIVGKYGCSIKIELLKLLSCLEHNFNEIALFEGKAFLVMKRLIHIILIQLKKNHKMFKFPNENLVLLYQLAEKWWNQMDPLKLQIIKKQKLEEFLKQKEIISNEREVDTLLRTTINYDF